MPRSNLPLVGHSSALSRLTGSSPVAALASSHLFTTLLRQLYNDRRQTEYTAYTLSTRRREAHRVCRRQGHPRTETAYPPPRRRVRHDRQQLHAGKGFQLQTESEADSKAGGRHGNPYRLPERPFELHLRPPWHGPGKRRQMFGSYPFMLGWLKELGKLAKRITGVLDRLRTDNRLPDGTRNDEDKEEES